MYLVNYTTFSFGKKVDTFSFMQEPYEILDFCELETILLASLFRKVLSQTT